MNNPEITFPVNEFLEVLDGKTHYRSALKWIAVVVVNHPHYGRQTKLYFWLWKNNRWSTQAKIILNDHQYNDISLEGIEKTRKDLWEEYK